MYKVLFYIVFLPLSVLPMRLLYLISDFLCWILKDVVKYRKAVVLSNLKNSFPDKDDAEIKAIAVSFYRHLADVFIEAFKMLSLSKKQLLIRYKCVNPELINDCYKDGKSVILISGHFNNWEYLVLSLDMQFAHHGVGVGKPLSNKGFGKVLTQFRTRYGTEVVDATNTRETFENYEKNKFLSAYMMLNDQSPGNPSKCYWMNFLNQETPVIYGPEYFAKKYNYPVFFYAVKKVKRGYYEFEIKPIAMDPSQVEYGQIIEKSSSMLEALINEQPAYWLWSHKRWKHKRTEKIA